MPEIHKLKILIKIWILGNTYATEIDVYDQFQFIDWLLKTGICLRTAHPAGTWMVDRTSPVLSYLY